MEGTYSWGLVVSSSCQDRACGQADLGGDDFVGLVPPLDSHGPGRVVEVPLEVPLHTFSGQLPEQATRIFEKQQGWYHKGL